MYLLDFVPDIFINNFERWYYQFGLVFSKQSSAKDISQLRNDFAHGGKKLEFSQKTVLDYEIFQICFAYFQIYHYSKDESKSVEYVKKIFNINLL